MLNGHGDDRYLFGKTITADFSSNVYYKGVSEGLQQQLIDSLLKVNNYPEANGQSLQKALSLWHQCKGVLVTNGATEAFYLIAHAYRNQSVTIVIPAFAEYEDACKANDISISYQLWTDITADTVFNTKLVFFGNPNNPTGSVFSRSLLNGLLKNNSDTVFIIDEAYIDFTTADISMVSYIDNHNNLIIVKSLTKTYSIPGLRLGYLLSNSNIIQHIQRYKMPWSVNALAVEAGIYITTHKEKLPLDELLADTKTLITRLRSIPEITVMDTQTNFCLCHTAKGTAALLKQFLLDEYGILIRDAANFRSLSPQHFRVATQTPVQNQLLVKGIQAWINS